MSCYYSAIQSSIQNLITRPILNYFLALTQPQSTSNSLTVLFYSKSNSISTTTLIISPIPRPIASPVISPISSMFQSPLIVIS